MVDIDDSHLGGLVDVVNVNWSRLIANNDDDNDDKVITLMAVEFRRGALALARLRLSLPSLFAKLEQQPHETGTHPSGLR